MPLLRSGLVLAGLGCAIGVLLGGSAGTLLQVALIGVEPLDPLTFVVVPASLLLVSMVASILPGMQAVSIGPAEALRDE